MRELGIGIAAILALMIGVGALDRGPDAHDIALAPRPPNPARFGSDENPSWGPALDMIALIYLTEARGDRHHLPSLKQRLDEALEAMDTRTNRTDEVRGRVMPGWGNRHYSAGLRHAWMVHAAILARPMVEFARLARLDPHAAPELTAAAGRYLDTAQAIVEAYARDARWDGEHLYYVFPEEWRSVDCEAARDVKKCMHYRSLAGTPLPFNMIHAMGTLMLALRAADPARFDFRREIIGMAKHFRAHLVLVGCERIGCPYGPQRFYTWRYLIGGRKEDVSHAGQSIGFVTGVVETGLGIFGREDLRRFANTFLVAVTKGADLASLDAVNGIAYHVDGSGKVESQHKTACIRWLPLAATEPRIARLCEAIYHANRLTRGVRAKAYFGRFVPEPAGAAS